jgi:adenylosuccinate synthase
MRRVIAISGPVAVGKSAVINELIAVLGAHRISTRQLIESQRDVRNERVALQEAGDSLDRETDGAWVADGLAIAASSFASDATVIVDSVRIARQVAHLRARYPGQVWHVHLTAPTGVLAARFAARSETNTRAVEECQTYEGVRANATEANVGALAATADLVLDTQERTPADVAAEIEDVLQQGR